MYYYIIEQRFWGAFIVLASVIVQSSLNKYVYTNMSLSRPHAECCIQIGDDQQTTIRSYRPITIRTITRLIRRQNANSSNRSIKKKPVAAVCLCTVLTPTVYGGENRLFNSHALLHIASVLWIFAWKTPVTEPMLA